MSLYAANNIASAVNSFGARGYAHLQGVILNAKNIPDEEAVVQKALAEIGTPLIHIVPRSTDIQFAEENAQTVFATVPESPQCAAYQQLAGKILAAAV